MRNRSCSLEAQMRVPISAKESTVLWKTLASVLFKGIMKAAALAIALVAAAIVIQQTTSARNKETAKYLVGKPGAYYVGNERKRDRFRPKRTSKAPGTSGKKHLAKTTAHLQGTENESREINSLQSPGQQLGGGETMGNELNLISQVTGPGNMAIPPMSGYGGMMELMPMGMGLGPGMGMGMNRGMGMRNDMSNAMIPMVVGQLGQALGRTAAMIAKTFAMRKRKSSAGNSIAAAASSRPRNTEYPHGGGGTNGNTFAGGSAAAASSHLKNMEYPHGSGGTNGSTFAGGGVMGTSNQPGPAQSVTGNSREANSISREKNVVQEYKGEGYSVGNATQWE
ncbi:uncharacterized protein LOC119167858 isoform X2 [Rhipicephalus microplus]|uniref:uncharacterized protein LOC119167858 isoform X2 n=1 Tax=Rhipicephalus microplus TaxID=6941 RepID=UPI003F6D943A